MRLGQRVIHVVVPAILRYACCSFHRAAHLCRLAATEETAPRLAGGCMFMFLSRYWRVLVLRGVIPILLIVLASIFPFATLAVLVLLFGAYVFIDGAFATVSGGRRTEDKARPVDRAADGLMSVGRESMC